MKARTLLISLLLLLIYAPAGLGQTQATVAAWNIKGFEPIPPTRTRLIARAIHNMSPDVIALSEVNSSNAQETLDLMIATLGELGSRYRFVFLPQTSLQSLAILFKDQDRVSVTNGQLIEGSDNNDRDLRRALSATVRVGRFDFILIVVHMKSARGAAERETRTRQAGAIADFISTATRGDEKDVLLIGDYNMIPGQDDVNFQTISPGRGRREFLRFISTESLRGQTSHFSRCSPTVRGNLLDGYAISRRFTREYREGTLRLIPFSDPIFRQPSGARFNCATYTGLVSDHLPLVARFLTNRDDD